MNSAHSVQKRAPDALEPKLHVAWRRKLWELKLGSRVRRCSQAPSHIFGPIDKTQTQRKSKGRGRDIYQTDHLRDSLKTTGNFWLCGATFVNDVTYTAGVWS